MYFVNNHLFIIIDKIRTIAKNFYDTIIPSTTRCKKYKLQFYTIQLEKLRALYIQYLREKRIQYLSKIKKISNTVKAFRNGGFFRFSFFI
jgi:hypothetical protein